MESTAAAQRLKAGPRRLPKKLRLRSNRNSWDGFSNRAGEGLLLAGSYELYQDFSPVRFRSMTDVFINTIGALVGASIACRYADAQD
jgi:hypothetical protein